MLRTIMFSSILWAACSFGAGLSRNSGTTPPPSSSSPSSSPSSSSSSPSSYEGVRAAPSPDPIAVPDVDGMSAERAEKTLRDAGFTGAIRVKDTTGCEWKREIAAGHVCGQSPEPGRTYNPRLPMELQVARPKEDARTAVMVDVMGLPLDQAVARLRDAGLPPPTVEAAVDARCAPNVVCRQWPESGKPASKQRGARLTVGAE